MVFIANILYLHNNLINPNLFFCKKKEIRINKYYRKLKLKKSLPHYKGWEIINYTISISYRNWDFKFKKKSYSTFFYSLKRMEKRWIEIFLEI
jgi:hypothetical protein